MTGRPKNSPYSWGLKKWNRVVAAFGEAGQRKVARVGLVGANASANHDGVTNAELAAIHTFGALAMKLPARPFLAEGVIADSRQIGDVAAIAARRLANSKASPDQVMGLIGEAAVAAVRRYISTGSNLAPLSAKTIAAKGSVRPLVDTGQLVGAISYDVKASES